MILKVIDRPAPELCEAVNLELRSHNQKAAPVSWEARGCPENQGEALNVFAFDDDRRVIGGLFGTTQLSWLKVDIMAVVKGRRGEGIGAALLARAEELGMGRGCKYAFVETMDFQAPGFYRRAGYRVAGEVDDWDSHGHRKFFLAKDLCASARGRGRNFVS